MLRAMSETTNSIKGPRDESEKFRALINEVRTLIIARSKTPDLVSVATASTEIDEKPSDKPRTLDIVRHVYETCCSEVYFENIFPVCKKVDCPNANCSKNEESQRTNGSTVISPEREPQQGTLESEPFEHREPVAMIVYEPAIERNNRCSRIMRLRSRYHRERSSMLARRRRPTPLASE